MNEIRLGRKENLEYWEEEIDESMEQLRRIFVIESNNINPSLKD